MTDGSTVFFMSIITVRCDNGFIKCPLSLLGLTTVISISIITVRYDRGIFSCPLSLSDVTMVIFYVHCHNQMWKWLYCISTITARCDIRCDNGYILCPLSLSDRKMSVCKFHTFLYYFLSFILSIVIFCMFLKAVLIILENLTSKSW